MEEDTWHGLLASCAAAHMCAHTHTELSCNNSREDLVLIYRFLVAGDNSVKNRTPEFSFEKTSVLCKDILPKPQMLFKKRAYTGTTVLASCITSKPPASQTPLCSSSSQTAGLFVSQKCSESPRCLPLDVSKQTHEPLGYLYMLTRRSCKATVKPHRTVSEHFTSCYSLLF